MNEWEREERRGGRGAVGPCVWVAESTDGWASMNMRVSVFDGDKISCRMFLQGYDF